ncbi:MAG: GerW family sporulation protein [Clostridia bacterium]|nr:GerW family sporulation protein [Clostridia bacterium]
MADHALNDVLATTMEKIKSMLDVNTIIGSPISTPEGMTIIPISKVSFGFASGGSDFGKEPQTGIKFGGGAGAGATISPVGFLIINGENVRLLPMATAPGNTADRIVEMVPGVIDKISDCFKKDKETDK